MNKKFFNKDKYFYWNSHVIKSNDISLNKDIINEIENNCSYDILEIGNSGKVKKNKKISVKNRELYTRYKLNSELPYLKQYEHLISVNPPGKKYLCYIKNFSNKNQCIFINRYKDKNLYFEHQVLKVDIPFDSNLFKGTLLDGQAVKKKDGLWYYVIDDIYIYEGQNLMNNSFTERFKILNKIFESDKFEKIKNDYIDIYKNKFNDVIYFEIKLYVKYENALDLIQNYYRYFNYLDVNEKFQNNDNNPDNLNGDIPKGIIFTNIDINATKLYFILPIEDTKCNKEEIVDNDSSEKFIFKMKRTLTSDIYKLYCKSNDIIIFHSNACVPNLKSSYNISKFFKDKKLEFDNVDIDYENEEVIVECKYNNIFKKWYPIKLSNDLEITDEALIKNYESNHIYKNELYEKPKYKIPKYDSNNYLIFNENNILLDFDYIHNLLKKYGLNYQIKNKKLMQTAFIHRTYSKNFYIKEYNKDKSGKNQIYCKVGYNLITKNKKDTKKESLDLFDISNERLEWFGDSKLADIISTYLEKRFPNEDEGFLTLNRSKLVRKNTLYELGKKLGFQKYIVMSKHCEYYEDGRDNIDAIEDCFEAFIGALYKDLEESNMEYKLKEFIINIYEKEIDIIDIIQTDDNYRTQLMKHYHKLYNKNPIYKEAESDVNFYKINILEPLNNEIIATATDKSKKKAEQIAAKNALIYFQLI